VGGLARDGINSVTISGQSFGIARPVAWTTRCQAGAERARAGSHQHDVVAVGAPICASRRSGASSIDHHVCRQLVTLQNQKASTAGAEKTYFAAAPIVQKVSGHLRYAAAEVRKPCGDLPRIDQGEPLLRQ